MSKNPFRMRCSTDQESRQMPYAPDYTDDQAGSKWGESALQQRESQAAPAELFYGAQDQHKQQCRHNGMPRIVWKRIGDCAGYC